MQGTERGFGSTLGSIAGGVTGGAAGGAIGGAAGGLIDQYITNDALNSSLDKQIGLLNAQKQETMRLQALKKAQRFQEFKAGEAQNKFNQSLTGIDPESDVFAQLNKQYGRDFAFNEQIESQIDRLALMGIDASAASLNSQRPGKLDTVTGVVNSASSGLLFGSRF